MKKTLFLAVLAGAALAGCVKNEEIATGNSSPERITFEAPVVSIPTRAEEIYGNYPKSKNFAVYALYHADKFSSYGVGTLYMDNVTCKYSNTAINNITTGATATDYWAPANDYYWPKNGYLTFAAYAPETVGGVTWGESGFTFTDFTVAGTSLKDPNDSKAVYPTGQYDLLYSGRQYNKQNNATDVVSDQPYDGVIIPFKHALSSIIFKAKTEGDYSSTTTIKITGIKVNNVVSKGTFAQGLTYDTNTGETESDNNWTLSTDANDVKNYVVFPISADGPKEMELGDTEKFVNGVDDGIDANNNGITDEDEKEDYDTTEGGQIPDDPANNNDGTDDATKNDGVRRSDLILIPQELKRTGNEVTVTIEYTIKTNADKDPIPQSATFQLGVKKDNESEKTYVWEKGKRYIYHIAIGLDKIYFNPQVVNWEDVPGTMDIITE